MTMENYENIDAYRDAVEYDAASIVGSDIFPDDGEFGSQDVITQSEMDTKEQ